jgi:8-hydroxy-5-deazaflavin:NADPH oxidoreductase
MRIAVLGTGVVGRTLAARLDGLGHDVVIGTRDPAATMARTEPGGFGTVPYPQWQAGHPGIRLLSFAEAAAFDVGDISAARGTEMLLPLWLRLMGSFGHADFNFHISRG